MKQKRKELNLEKALQLYHEGKISVDKAAKIAGLTLNEIMNEIAAKGIKSDETIEEYKEGIKVLLKLYSTTEESQKNQ